MKNWRLGMTNEYVCGRYVILVEKRRKKTTKITCDFLWYVDKIDKNIMTEENNCMYFV